MTPPRTQEHRHWIRLAYAPSPEKNETPKIRARDFDLNMVDHVMVVYGENPNNPLDQDYAAGIRFTYAGLMKPIDLENWHTNKMESANFFWQEWNHFIELKAKAPRGILGLLHIPEVGSVRTQPKDDDSGLIFH